MLKGITSTPSITPGAAPLKLPRSRADVGPPILGMLFLASGPHLVLIAVPHVACCLPVSPSGTVFPIVARVLAMCTFNLEVRTFSSLSFIDGKPSYP